MLVKCANLYKLLKHIEYQGYYTEYHRTGKYIKETAKRYVVCKWVRESMSDTLVRDKLSFQLYFEYLLGF